jgi:MoxR-like ATPase
MTAHELFVSGTTIDMTTDPATNTQSVSTVYHTDGITLANAEIFFGDEVYKANSRTLNALLTLINERQYDMNRQRHNAPLMSGFFASNELPETDGSDGLAAFHDRILVRLPTDPIKQLVNQVKVFTTQLAHRRNLAHGTVAPMKTISLDEVKKLQQVLPDIWIPEDVFVRLIKLADMIEQKCDIYISQRRRERALKLLQARALFAGRPQVSKNDLTILRFVFWENPEDFDATEKLIRENVLDPTERRMSELKNSAFELIRSAEKKVADGDWLGAGINEELQGAIECLRALDDLKRSAKPEVRREIDSLMAEISDARKAVLSSLGNPQH